ncbi:MULTISPECIES: NAD(P)-dependent oxidoreductase [unclassified Roseibium]|uniref:NAD-dependent epimerase/dehydratase family protein n=1 Tax=unclassified Roseibium TaxID=2629323 RepID=UPI00273D4BD6|nr:MULTISPECIES: NAD-dependent epimerase/dehydratase family protein [unclassified Roseibium]
MSRAVVFGGAGFIGSHLLRSLKESGKFKELVSVDLVAPRAPVETVDYKIADIRRPLPVDLCQAPDVIYNLAAIHRTPGHETHEYYETNVAGATHICEFARALGVKKIVFTSSIAVYGPDEAPKEETTPTAPQSAYGWSKLLAEQIQQSWQQEAPDRKLVISRPAVVFGAGENGNFTRLAGALKKGFFLYPGRKDTIKACGYVDELIRSFDFMLGQKEGQSLYNFCYPHPYTIEEICQSFERAGGLSQPRGVVPLPLMKLASMPFEILNAFGIRNGINRARIQKLVVSTNIVPAKLKSSGYVFETDLDSALKNWRATSLIEDGFA